MTPVVTYGELLGMLLGVVVVMIVAMALFRRPHRRRPRFHRCPYCQPVPGGDLVNALCTVQGRDHAWCMRCGAFYLRVWGYWERPDRSFPESYRTPAAERVDP